MSVVPGRRGFPVLSILPSSNWCWCRRKTCCHPFVAGDVFKYMSVLIKLSNHLGLILPGEWLPSFLFWNSNSKNSRTNWYARTGTSSVFMSRDLLLTFFCRLHGTGSWLKLHFLMEILQNMERRWCNPNIVASGPLVHGFYLLLLSSHYFAGTRATFEGMEER